MASAPSSTVTKRMGRGARLNSISTLNTSFRSSSTNKNVVILATTVVHAYKRFLAMGHTHTCKKSNSGIERQPHGAKHLPSLCRVNDPIGNTSRILAPLSKCPESFSKRCRQAIFHLHSKKAVLLYFCKDRNNRNKERKRMNWLIITY